MDQKYKKKEYQYPMMVMIKGESLKRMIISEEDHCLNTTPQEKDNSKEN